MNSVPLLVTGSIVLLALVGLVTLFANRVKKEQTGALFGIGVAWVLLVGLSVMVQYQLYTIRPSFFDMKSDSAALLLADFIVGMLVVIGVFSYIDKLTD